MMNWYTFFSLFYDVALERSFRPVRQNMVELLDLRPGQKVLDVPCGTGQSLRYLRQGVGDEGCVFGIDINQGMLKKSRRRVEKSGWRNVYLEPVSVHAIEARTPFAGFGRMGQVDRLMIFLGLSVFPDWEQAFLRAWELLAPGGKCVVVDVFSDQISSAAKLQNRIARADITREFWRPLESVCDDFQRHRTPALHEHGGEVWSATGLKA